MNWLFDLGLFLILSLCVVGTVVGVSRFRYRWWLCLLLFLPCFLYTWISISIAASPEEEEIPGFFAPIVMGWSLGDLLWFAFLVVFAACPARGVVDAVEALIRWIESKRSSDS